MRKGENVGYTFPALFSKAAPSPPPFFFFLRKRGILCLGVNKEYV